MSPWWWRRYVPPKRQFLQEPHGITSQKTALFINVFNWILIIGVYVHRINTGFCEAQTLIGHSNFVVCVCILPPHDGHPLGVILTGSNDRCICAFAPDSSEPLYVLKGHTNAGMCSVFFWGDECERFGNNVWFVGTCVKLFSWWNIK
jgi:hypothetical protein